MQASPVRDLAEVKRDKQGKKYLHINLHDGQKEAMQSEARFTAILAGTQGGKTSFGPFWLVNEIKTKGPGDYMVVTPTYKLLQLKALPEFRKLFEDQMGLGTYRGSTAEFVISRAGEIALFNEPQSTPTRVLFGHAQDPESLESATAKAAWLDEAGQKKFKVGSFEAILRRLSLYMGRVLITTTIYNLGWLKQRIWDRWKAGDPDYKVVRFPSTANPRFSKEEDARARRDLPRWKYDMFYQAIFTRPAGLIYDSFDESKHVIPRFDIPEDWPRFLGLDFGGVNTAGIFFAAKPDTPLLIGYREYLGGGKTARDHARELLEGEPMVPFSVGGAWSEDNWRIEFGDGGLAVVRPPIKDVEVGIDRVYGAHKRNEILIFDDLYGYLDQKVTYSRELDDAGNPTEKIEDKETYHYLDAERYIIAHLKGAEGPMMAMV